MSAQLGPALVGVIAVQALERSLYNQRHFMTDAQVRARLDTVQVLRRALQPHQREAMTNLTEAADRAYRRQQHIPEAADEIAQELGRDLLYTLALTSPSVPY